MSPDVGTCDWLVGEIDSSRLATRADIAPIAAEFKAEHPYADATALAEHLVELGRITPFQATRLLEGDGTGLVLGPYVLIDSVGSGSMGMVYKALGKADRKAYALKVLPARGPWNVRLARRRLAAFPTAPHSGVVPFLDVGTSAGQHYLVWPFVEGETLEALVEYDGPIAPEQTAQFGMQIAQTLRFCDLHGVYHGLVKPSNILITSDGRVKLLDFGVGAMLADAESNDSLVDTLSESNTALNMLDCLSPEAIVDPAQRSIRGDQYGLGCTLFFALSGRFPFPDGTAFEKMAAHHSTPPPLALLPPGTPAQLVRIVERLMQKSPELRYNNLDELIEALQSLAGPAAATAAPSLLPSPAPGLRGPTTTPVRGVPTLLSAVQPRSMPAPARAEVTPAPRARSILAKPATPATAFPHPVVTPEPTVPHLPQPPSAIARLFDRLMFWKPRSGPVACTLLTPGSFLPGESAAVQVVLHAANRSAQAESLPDWRGTETVGPDVRRGAAVGLHLSLQRITLGRPMQTVSWGGYSSATIFSLRVPDEWPMGTPVQGTLTITVDDERTGQLQFVVPVGAPEPNSV